MFGRGGHVPAENLSELRARAEGEGGVRRRGASAEAQANGVGGWMIKGESGGRERRASAEGERGVPMKNPPFLGGLVSVRSEAASVASGHTPH